MVLEAIFFILHSIYGCAQLPSSSGTDDIFRLTSYSLNFINTFSVSLHPAAAAQLKKFEAGVHSERRFMLAQLNQYTICGSLPIKLGGIGIDLRHFGDEDFNQQEVGLAFGRSLGKIDLGIKFGYERGTINGYKPLSSVSAQLSNTWHVSEKLHTGLDLGVFYSNNKFPVDQSTSIAFACGLGYEVSPFVLIGFSINADPDQSASFNPGIYYRFADQFFASMCITTQPTQLYFGGGWKWNSLRIEATTSYHFQLGFTPGLLLVFQPKGK